MRRVVYILLILGLYQPICGQDREDFFYFDSITFRQYNDGQWRDLAKYGKKALRKGFDFYYMRMRLGISYYERRDYLLATKHFRKAMDFNNGDQLAAEYLYYCYLFSGKYYAANTVTSLFRPALLEKTGVQNADRSRVAIDYLYNTSKTDQIINHYLAINSIQEAGNLIIPVSYMNAGVTFYHNSRPGLDIKHSLSYLRRENSLFTSDGTLVYQNYAQKVNQVQYFISPIFSTQRGLSISPSLFYQFSSYPLLEFRNLGMQSYAYSYPVTENNVGVGSDLRFSTGIVEVGANAFISNIGYRNHIQAGTDFLMFPLANNSLYMGAGYNIKTSEQDGNYIAGHVIEITAGITINNKFFLDFSILNGEIENFIEDKAQIVYNGINEIDRILKLDISVPVVKTGLLFYLGARYQSEHIAFVPEDYLYPEINGTEFYSYSLIGGLSWTF